MVELDEEVGHGLRFNTSISITSTRERVIVYAALSCGASKSVVAPTALLDAHCPRVVRDILKTSSEWRHGETRIEGLMPANGAEMGNVLANAIMSPARTLPILVVTDDDEGELVYDQLDTLVAHDLAGLARVYRLDPQAAWGLTQALEPKWACYYGAVRLYWPGFKITDPSTRHPRWTPDDILGSNDDIRSFAAHLRRVVFRAAAVNIQRPEEAEEIRSTQAAAALEVARSESNFEKIAESYQEDNERLSHRVTELEHALAEAQIQLENALAVSASTLDPSAEREIDPAVEVKPGPAGGEVRFYKKTGSTSKRDRMVVTGDCGCNNWEGGWKGDKARKGIAALEQRTDWKAMWHCASCTGGGMWKVKW